MRSLSVSELASLIGSPAAPLVIDVRRQPAFDADGVMIAGAIRRPPNRLAAPASTRPVVVYCVHGHEVSQAAAARLGCAYLEGGIEAWRQAGGPTRLKHPAADGLTASRWVTRERPKIDRLACPWLIRRFIDPFAVIDYRPPREVATAPGTPFDIPDVTFSHRGQECSFDAFVADFGLSHPALDRLAAIIRGADTERHGLTPQSAGLFAISLGLGRLYTDDRELLEQGMILYDALYAWCRDLTGETHAWPPRMA
ncbi:MAG: chromate resistance protein [Thalassobaculales bacterium]